ELEPALLAEREVRRELFLLVGEAAEFEQLVDLAAHRRLAAKPARKETAAGPILGRVLRDPEVLPDRQLPEQPNVLKRAPDARLQALVRRQPADVLAAEVDHSGIEREQSGDQVDRRALPGAVRPDQADDLALADRQVELV